MHAARRWLVVLAAAAATVTLTSDAAADRTFGLRWPTSPDDQAIQGDITIAANSILTCVDDPAPGGICEKARKGEATPASANNNNNRTMTWIDADDDKTTTNASSADLDLPRGATVEFAGLYYGGRPTAACTDDLLPQCGSPPPSGSAKDKVKFKAPGQTSYGDPLTASQVDDSSTQFQGFVDVTTTVRNALKHMTLVGGRLVGTFWAADIHVGTGKSDSTSGGWALVVAYGDSNAPSRNLAVFDGLQNVSGNNTVSIPLSGFRTPLSGDVISTVGIVAYEGDLGTTGDGAQIQDKSGVFKSLSNASPNPSNNVFNSTITRAGAHVTSREPKFQNNLGYDADLFTTTNALGRDQTSTQVRLTTSGDTYQPGVVTLATDLYAPKITPTKTVDLATASLGDTLTYTVALQNTGQDAANSTIFRDPIPAGAVFVPGSIVVDGTPVSDAAGDDMGEFAGGQVVARLGAGATPLAGGSLGLNASATVSFQVTVATSGLTLGATIANTADIAFVAATTGKASTVTTAPATTQVLVPDLAIGKTHDPPLSPGQPSTYTITVGNIGDGPTSGPVTVTDTIEPPGLTINGTPAGDGWDCSTLGTTVTCTRSDPLPVLSDYPPISIPVLVSPSAQPGLLSNTVSLQAPSDGRPSNNSFTDAGALSEPAIDLHVEKTVTSTPSATPAGYVPDDIITYRIEVTNTGVADAANVQFVDTFEAPLIFLGFGGSGGSGPPGPCTFTDPTLTCDIGTIAPGQPPVVIELTARLPFGSENYPSNRLLDNTATVSAPVGVEMNPGDNSSSAAIPTFPAADISIEKTFSPAQPLAGGPITYTVTMRNHGPDTVDAIMDDGLPEACVDFFDCRPLLVLPPTSISITGGTGVCEFTDTSIRGAFFPRPLIACDIPQFAPGTERVITYTSTLALDSAGTEVFNGATGIGMIPLAIMPFSWDADPFPWTDNFAGTTFTPGSVDLTLQKSRLETGTLPVGSETTFRLVAGNQGTVATSGVVVTDTLPDGLTLVSAPPACTSAGQTVTCDAGTLGPGAEQTFDLRVRAEVAGADRTLTNLATATSADPDVAAANNTAAADVTIGPFSTLSVTKTASATSVPAGSPITFTATVQNNGPSAAGTVNLTDVLPTGLALRSVTPSRGSCTGASCNLGDLPAGATAQVVVVVDTDASAIGKRLVNAVEVTAATPSSPAKAEAPVEVTAPPVAPTTVDVAVEVHGPTGLVREGGIAAFRIDVTNHGPARATSVVLTGTANRAVRAAVIRLLQEDCTRLPLRCDLGTLAPGQRRSFTVRVRRLVPGRLTLTASVTTAQTETTRANNMDRASIQVRLGRTTLGLSKRPDTGSAQSGSAVAFTIVVRNKGSIPARNLVVCDRLPNALAFERLGGARLAEGRACWALRRLAPGATARYHVVTTALNGQHVRRVTNIATVRGANVARKNAKASVRLRPPVRQRPPFTG